MRELRTYQQQAVKECWNSLRLNDDPVLLMASVGAGKSLMIAHILLRIQSAGKRALCLVNNAELVRNNCATLIDEGDVPRFIVRLWEKNHSAPIVFGTPQSVLNAINKNEPLAHITFNIIIVDEAHAINYKNPKTCFMRILRHYKHHYPQMRVLGATGTNFRFKGEPIVGDACLFKTQVGNITTESLIEKNYLIHPKFEIDEQLVLDFSQVKIKHNGQFDARQLEDVVTRSASLTELICKQVVHIMEAQNRFGVFLFATTKKHAHDILSHLPSEQSALILGETPQDERTRILDEARSGRIRYLVNISIISVGVDIPAYDTIAYLRPTESLVLLVQTMGRVLRLSEATGKSDALALDFAGNIERHRDWDDPILEEAVKKTIDKDKPLVILCPACSTLNTEHARRCVGRPKGNTVRCDYYFEFKSCVCGAQNDIAARICHTCNEALIDPDEKLTLIKKSAQIAVKVLEANYGISGAGKSFRVHCTYKFVDEKGTVGSVHESYSPVSEKSLRVFYGQFVKKHCVDASKWYIYLYRRDKVEQMLRQVQTPLSLLIAKEEQGVRIKKKIF